MIVNANALHIPLADKCVHTIVTSPPYFGLRDYGTATWEGGDVECDHIAPPQGGTKASGLNAKRDANGYLSEDRKSQPNTVQFARLCKKCGAIRIDAQIGLEPTPDEYISNLVAVFRECKRILRDDGTCWINIADSYYSDTKGSGGPSEKQESKAGSWFEPRKFERTNGIKPKDLIGIPWMLAFALRANGWYLRQDIIWAKPNPMPESVKDRCTKSHEYIFLFSKGQWKSRVVNVSDLPSEFVHFGNDFGLSTSYSGSGKISVLLATSIFNSAQRQDNFSLPPFYSEVWKKNGNGVDSDFISRLPKEHIPAMFAARFLASDTSAKQFLCEIYGLGITHSNSDKFLIGGCPVELSLTPPLNTDGDTSFSINNTGEICKFDYVHNTIVTQSSSGCKYYYDSEAISEPSSCAEDPRAGFGRLHYRGKREGEYGTGNENFVQITNVRNKRDVWTVTTKPYKGAHFATFNPELIKPCILAGAPEGGVVFDPFVGSGTTVATAMQLGRKGIGLDLSLTYLHENARERINNERLPLEELFNQSINQTRSEITCISD